MSPYVSSISWLFFTVLVPVSSTSALCPDPQLLAAKIIKMFILPNHTEKKMVKHLLVFLKN
jgi:hypothetical protein